MKKYIIPFLFIACTFLASCGYNFAGSSPINMPEDKRHLFISQLINPTQEAWLEPYLRSNLRDEFTRRGQVNWVSLDQAEALMQIEVIQFRTSDSQTGAKDRTVRSTVTLIMDVKIVSASTGEVIWSSGSVTGSSSFFLQNEDRSMPGAYGPGHRKAAQEATDQAITRTADRLGDAF
ncbi:MAG: LPS assembly lipoprotein LptE [Desulfovibrionales bacterium]|nr:LPS assembly lipoprotein LptE [Desulfovibrionales bacterium]